MRNNLTFLAFLLITIGYSQNTLIKGFILEEETKAPIPYSNIIVPNKNIGTISKSDGSFVLDPKHAKENDTIAFSALGFKTQSFTLKSLKEFLGTHANILLRENIEELDEVIVFSKTEWKRKILGSETNSVLGYGFGPTIGGELGRKIRIRKQNTHLLKFKAHVFENSYESIKLRLNFYTIVDGLPGEKINTKNIYVDFINASGYIEVDLESYNIVVSDNIIVTLQWVDYEGTGDFKLSSKIPSTSKLLLKQFGHVSKFPITLGYNLLVKY